VYTITRLEAFSLIACATLLHITVLGGVRLFGAVPDLVFALVLFFGLFGERRVAVEAALFAGLMKDIFSSGPFGFNIITLVLVVLIASKIAPHFYRETTIAQGALTAVFFVCNASAYYLVRAVGTAGSAFLRDCLPSYPDYFIGSILPACCYTTVVAVVAFPALMESFRVNERLML